MNEERLQVVSEGGVRGTCPTPRPVNEERLPLG